MIAKDILCHSEKQGGRHIMTTVSSDMPVFDVLPRLLDNPERELGVMEDGKQIGVINQTSMLEGIGRMIAPRDDCSVITVECAPEDFSASLMAHAVEDSDAHLVDLLSTPSDNGNLKVLLRVRHTDPAAAVRSLERYNFKVTDAHAASDSIMSVEIATERLLSLQALMNV